MRTTGYVEGIADRLGEPWSFTSALDRDRVILTDEHAAASRGLPVAIYHDRAYGPGDLPGLGVLVGREAASADDIAQLRGAGWTVRVLAVCRWCGETLDDPEDRSIDDHPECAASRRAIRSRVR